MKHTITKKTDGPITQTDMARVFGVSQVTIHKALTGQPGVSGQLRKEIVNLAANHGYRLNIGARVMRQRRTNNISLVLSATESSRSSLPENLLRHIALTLEAHNHRLMVAYFSDEQLTDDTFVPSLLSEWICDGLLINYNVQVPTRLQEMLSHYRIPVVWLNDKKQRSAIYPDDERAGYDATRLLLGMGHRRIAYTHMSIKPGAHYSEQDRMAGYERAMREAGLATRVVGMVDSESDHGPLDRARRLAKARETCESLLGDTMNRPSAIIDYGGPSLEPVVRTADRLHLDIPQDLSLVSFSQQSRSAGMGIAFMQVPESEMGRLAVEKLLEIINNPEAPLPNQAVPFTLHSGHRLAPPSPAFSG